MPSKRHLYYNDEAKRFRAIVRPAMFGRIGQVESQISNEMANTLFNWLADVVEDTMRATKLHDDKRKVRSQLFDGIRVVGRSSMASLVGRIDAYPWLFAHEYGGKIKAQGDKFLTIPIFYGLRPDGSPKFKSAASWKRFGSFVYTQKATGKKFLAYKSKESNELRILYILVDHIDIPARLHLNRVAARDLGVLLAEWIAIWVGTAGSVGLTNPFIGEA